MNFREIGVRGWVGFGCGRGGSVRLADHLGLPQKQQSLSRLLWYAGGVSLLMWLSAERYSSADELRAAAAARCS